MTWMQITQHRCRQLWRYVRERDTIRAEKKRRLWEETAVWFRLRYDNAQQAQEMLDRLSTASGRVALRWRSELGLACYIGALPTYQQAIRQMGRDFACHLTTEPMPPPPRNGRFAPATTLPDSFTALDGYLIRGTLYLLTDEGEIFPQASTTPNEWQLPPPVLGTATRLSLTLPAPRPLYRHDRQDWLLGWDAEGKSVGLKQVGVVGDETAVHHWTQAHLLAHLREGRTGIALLDGSGQLVDTLLERPDVRRQLTTGTVSLLDIWQAARVAFNPLARAGQSHWLWWFQGMGVPKPVLDTLPKAIQAGVQTLPDLYAWAGGLKDASYTATLRTFLERLAEDRAVEQWLMQPERSQDLLRLAGPGILLATARLGEGSRWARQQGLRGLLGLLLDAGMGVILHGVPLSVGDRKLLANGRWVATQTFAPQGILITRCAGAIADQVAGKLNWNHTDHGVTAEHLRLLPLETAVLAHPQHPPALLSWKKGQIL